MHAADLKYRGGAEATDVVLFVWDLHFSSVLVDVGDAEVTQVDSVAAHQAVDLSLCT